MNIIKVGNPDPDWWSGLYNCSKCRTQFSLDSFDKKLAWKEKGGGPGYYSASYIAAKCPVCKGEAVKYVEMFIPPPMPRP